MADFCSAQVAGFYAAVDKELFECVSVHELLHMKWILIKNP